jgi:hypothetical protein
MCSMRHAKDRTAEREESGFIWWGGALKKVIAEQLDKVV